MAKRKKLSELDPESQDYWEEVLRYHKLGMGRGKSSLVRYASDKELAAAERDLVGEPDCGGGRRARPSGTPPE